MLLGKVRECRDSVSIWVEQCVYWAGEIRTGELAEEDHDVGVDDGTAGTGNGDEIEPGEAAGSGFFGVELIDDGVLHDEELLAVFLELRPADALPDVEGFEGAALVHEEAGGFGHEEHACQHDGGEDEGGTEHVTPAAALQYFQQRVWLCGGIGRAYLDVDENGGNDIPKDLAKSDVELVEGDQIPTVLSCHGLGNIDRHGSTCCISLGQHCSFGGSTGAPRHCLGAPDLLEQRENGLRKSYLRDQHQGLESHDRRRSYRS